MSEQIVVDRHFVASLTEDEYISVRVSTAKKRLWLKDWITQAIREKLEKEKEEQ